LLQNTARSPLRDILLYGFIAILIALPQVFYLLADGAGGEFFQLWPGWMAKGQENALWFWTKNFGAVFWGWIVVVGAAVFFGVPSSNHRRAHDNNMMAEGRSPARARAKNSSAVFPILIIASVVLFAAGNLVKFQPWEFDNGKVLLWWWLLAALITLFAIGKIIETRRKLGITLFIVFTFFGTFAGFLDVIGRLKVFPDRSYGYYGTQEIQAARWIRANTAPSDPFLSAGNANDFVPILTGRPLYLGFGGWLWTHGKGELLRERQNAISEFLLLGNQQQLCAGAVKYIVWDRQFESAHPNAKKARIADKLEKAFEQPGRTIYRLQCINADSR
jgi:hypothetical protein